MQKKEVFKVEDSNVAGLGSDLDKKCREAAAAGEKAWAVAGKKPGMQIWRIEQFKVCVSQTPPGTFYSDDSYICLNTYKKKDDKGKELEKLGWDIHFWLGKPPRKMRQEPRPTKQWSWTISSTRLPCSTEKWKASSRHCFCHTSRNLEAFAFWKAVSPLASSMSSPRSSSPD